MRIVRIRQVTITEIEINLVSSKSNLKSQPARTNDVTDEINDLAPALLQGKPNRKLNLRIFAPGGGHYH